MNNNFIVNILSGIFFFSELILLIVKRAKTGEDRVKQDKKSLWILWGTISASVFTAKFAARILPPFEYYDGLVWVGAGILLVGMALRMTAIYQLGAAFTVDVAVSSSQKVKDNGLYKRVRHPSYTGGLLEIIGLSLTFNSWYPVFIINILVFIAMFYRIGIEEKALCKHFGAAYEDYMARTKRLIPFLL